MTSAGSDEARALHSKKGLRGDTPKAVVDLWVWLKSFIRKWDSSVSCKRSCSLTLWPFHDRHRGWDGGGFRAPRRLPTPRPIAVKKKVIRREFSFFIVTSEPAFPSTIGRRNMIDKPIITAGLLWSVQNCMCGSGREKCLFPVAFLTHAKKHMGRSKKH